MRKLLFILSLILFTGFVAAQSKIIPLNHKPAMTSGSDDPIILRFKVSSKEQIDNDLTYLLSIDNVSALAGGKGYQVTAYATSQQFQQFLSRNIPYELVKVVQPKAITMANTVAQMVNWDRYPTYSVYEQMMANFAATYPNLCDIDTILSQTPSGYYRILVAKISDNVHSSENEPQFLYTSSIHGDETTGYILMLRMIDYLLTNYGSNSKVTNLVNNVEIWINPLANPDGTYYNSTPVGSSITNARRGNLANVDLNRNYPDPRAGQHPDGKAWQAETQAFMNFANAHHFNMSCNFHGGAEVFNYPWDTWVTSGNPNADAAWWIRVGRCYVDTAQLVTPTYLKPGSSIPSANNGVTEGGDWYVITGGRQDYMNYFKQCREVTIELDNTKKTPSENLNLKWNQNFHSILNCIQESTYGLQGVITNSCTGQPIRAKVWVNGYDQVNDSSQVYSSLPVGNYYKYMIAGVYNITYSAPGFISKTITGVVVNNGASTVQDIQLDPVVTLANKTLKVKVFLEGLYLGGGLMNESHNFDSIAEIFFPEWGTGIADTVTVELYDNTYENMVARFPGAFLHTDGKLAIQNISECLNSSYYITIYQRNSVPVTSATPQPFSGDTIIYDFTYPADKAYGIGLDPQKDLGDGYYGMYSGELNQDEYFPINGYDLSIMETDIVTAPFGYLKTDLNGDGVINAYDLILEENNIVKAPLFWNPSIAK
jgi:hypothetical protein